VLKLTGLVSPSGWYRSHCGTTNPRITPHARRGLSAIRSLDSRIRIRPLAEGAAAALQAVALTAAVLADTAAAALSTPPCTGSSVGRARRCRCRRTPCTGSSGGRAV
jgi:hypothetical protein